MNITAGLVEEQVPMTSTMLDGKVAVVTGAARGIGREAAKILVERGAHVVVSDVSAEGADETIEYLGGGDHAAFVIADVVDPAAMERLATEAVARFGRLDIAYNNAGVDSFGPKLAEVTHEEFSRVMSVNVAGIFNSMRAQIPVMLQFGGGSIVNAASALGEVGIVGQSVYVASKHAVLGLTKNAALEYSSQGIRVNAVLPGVIDTPIIQEIETHHPGFVETVTQFHPIGRIGSTRDVGELVAWLACDAAAFVTGASFAVDGGYLAH